jgi:hypothetical protein
MLPARRTRSPDKREKPIDLQTCLLPPQRRLNFLFYALCTEAALAQGGVRDAERAETRSSSFDKLRMRSCVINGLSLMVSLSNHGQRPFFSGLEIAAEAEKEKIATQRRCH